MSSLAQSDTAVGSKIYKKMYNYDFKILNYNEFECFTRDLIQAEEGFRIESFADGRDGGIDLRFAYGKLKNCIVQCKRYKDWNELKAKLKEEVAKVKKLAPKRYILSTTVDLTAKNKDEIKKMFEPYIQNTATDILAKADLNNLLAKHPDVEKLYYKLWLGSTAVLDIILHRSVINWSEFERDAIQAEIAKYVSNDSYRKAMEILLENRYVIISGIPGIGKTTLARMLVYNLLAQDYEEFVYVVDDLDKACEVYDKNKKQVFFFDDFLGSNSFVPQSTSFENKLILFIDRIKKSNNSIFIMTTREYILSEAKKHYEKIGLRNIELAKCTLDLSQYTKEVRARILYNHLFEAQLPIEYIAALVNGKKYVRMVEHKNFNPRVIEGFINQQIWKTTTPEKFLATALDYFDKPLTVWAKAFENLDTISRYALLVFATMPYDTTYEEWQSAFKHFCEAARASLGLFYDDNNWLSSVKVLQDCFVRITVKDGIKKVSSFNPSILDFCASYIRENKNTLQLLLVGAYYPEQVTSVFTDNVDACLASGNRIEISEDMFPIVEMKRQDIIVLFRKKGYPTKSHRNEIEFCSDLMDKFPIYCRRYYGVIEKSILVEDFYESTIDSSKRFGLIRKLDWSLMDESPLDVLWRIGIGEHFDSPEWADYAETTNLFGGLGCEIEDVITDHMKSQLMNEIDSIQNSADCEEVLESIRMIGENFASWVDDDVIEHLEMQELWLQEQEENMDYPDDRDYYPLHSKEDVCDYHEMFSSLYEEALNRKNE